MAWFVWLAVNSVVEVLRILIQHFIFADIGPDLLVLLQQSILASIHAALSQSGHRTVLVIFPPSGFPPNMMTLGPTCAPAPVRHVLGARRSLEHSKAGNKGCLVNGRDVTGFCGRFTCNISGMYCSMIIESRPFCVTKAVFSCITTFAQSVISLSSITCHDHGLVVLGLISFDGIWFQSRVSLFDYPKIDAELQGCSFWGGMNHPCVSVYRGESKSGTL